MDETPRRGPSRVAETPGRDEELEELLSARTALLDDVVVTPELGRW